MSGLTPCPRKCGTLMAVVPKSGVCTTCRRDDANDARKAKERAAKAAANNKPPRLKLDLPPAQTKANAQNTNSRSATANRSTNARRKG